MMKAAGFAMLLALTAPAGAAGITYDCDTAAEHWSELNLPADRRGFSVTGNVQLSMLAASKTFVPTVRIQVAESSPPGKPSAHYAGFSLGALPVGERKTPAGQTATQMLSYNVSGKDDEVLPMSMLVNPGAVQPFSMVYDGSSLAVTIVESKSFPLKLTDPVVRIVCSTGEFLITDLTITPR
ncbi:hypothetical protein [Sphingomonas sp.]|uniref:hypothetical protein n=1 Tax=Sphingomonas sp. TaxID=28214 RepID=UPI003B3A4D24